MWKTEIKEKFPEILMHIVVCIISGSVVAYSYVRMAGEVDALWELLVLCGMMIVLAPVAWIFSTLVSGIFVFFISAFDHEGKLMKDAPRVSLIAVISCIAMAIAISICRYIGVS